MTVSDLQSAITALNTAVATLDSATTNLTATDLATVVNSLTVVSQNLQTVIADFPSYNTVMAQISERASGATQTVAANLRKIITDLVATQATYFGPDNTSAPVVHANKATGSINIPAYYGGNGEIIGPNNGGPSLDVLKKSIPSTYDVVAMMVSMYHGMLTHTHELNTVTKVANAPNATLFAALFATATMGSEVTLKDQSEHAVVDNDLV